MAPNPTGMTREQHKRRHKLLHRNLDELIADFIACGPLGKALARTSVIELMEWSAKQQENPELPRGATAGEVAAMRRHG